MIKSEPLELSALQSLCKVISYHVFTSDPLNLTLSFPYTVCDKEIPNVDMTHLLPAGCLTIYLQHDATLLSCKIVLRLTLMPWALRNNRLHRIRLIQSSTPTCSASVELFVFNFCPPHILITFPPSGSVNSNTNTTNKPNTTTITLMLTNNATTTT